MTEIIAGQYVTNELSKNSLGGTEQMALRMVRDIDPELLKPYQIIHSRVREINPDLKKILVIHDLANDPESDKLTDPEYRKQFSKIVFVSNWQAQMFSLTHGIPYAEFVVIPNAIEPIKITSEDKALGPDNQVRLIYHTTPHRGLGILYPAFMELKKHFNVTLDVYSSFKIYGWEERDKTYEPLFDMLRNAEGINYHGTVSNDEVRKALIKAHIFAYPSIWPETSCIAAIEALCAGAGIVHPNLAALPETTSHSTSMYQFNENLQDHLNVFYSHLYATVQGIQENTELFQNRIAPQQSDHFNAVYNWHTIVHKWENLLRNLKD